MSRISYKPRFFRTLSTFVNNLIIGKVIETEFGIIIQVLEYSQFLNQQVILRNIAYESLDLFFVIMNA